MIEVQIRRREKKSYLPPEVVADSKKILSSLYVGQGPLRVEDVDIIVCNYLGIDPKENDAQKRIREFWSDLRINVPADGYVLNITDTSSNPKQPEPVNSLDWLVFQWAKRHKYVALSKEEMEAIPHKQFYIHDPEKESQFTNKQVAMKRKAYIEFSKITDNEDKLNHVIRILSDTDPKRMSKTEKENYTDNLIEQNAKRFLEVVLDKNLEIKGEIAELVSANIIQKISNQHYFGEEKLGDTLEEAVLYFNDKGNSKTVMTLKAKLSEVRKVHG